MSEFIRLTKRMAQTGMFSRHEADILVSNGHVTVDGVIAIPGTKVPAEGAVDIRVDGKRLGQRNFDVYKFHKPKLVLSSYSDPNGKTNLSFFRELAAMKMGYSGRLDFDSEGLMLFTGNGELIHKLQCSEFKVEKEYIVNTDADISKEWLKRLEKGISSEGERFLPCVVQRLGNYRYKVILTEGKKRQVRIMFKEAGAKVTKLMRVRIGSIVLGDLPAGILRKLTDKEIKELMKCIESK